MALTLQVNGSSVAVDADPDTPLLYVLRDDLELNGAKYGCGLGQCGSCLVLVDGRAQFSCVLPALLLEGREITTLEGLGTVEAPGPVQQAFIDEQAAQCGYCIPGMIMRVEAVLRADPDADEAAFRAALMPHLCRCGTHMRILRAALRARDLRRTATAEAGVQAS